MKLFKMTIVKSNDFEAAVTACQMAFGMIVARKRTLIWIASFEKGDYEVIRDTLEDSGSEYRGTWHF